jgi:hypothetical protein
MPNDRPVPQPADRIEPSSPAGLGRWLVPAATLAASATVPYLVLKVDWVFGGTLGMTDSGSLSNTTYRVGNALTILMDLAVVALALHLIRPEILGLPQRPVRAAFWAASGFLVPLPVILVAVLASGSQESQATSGLSSWVWLLVYGGFVAQGIGLLTAFAISERTDWRVCSGRSTRQLTLLWGTFGCLGIAATVTAHPAGPTMVTALVGSGCATMAGLALYRGWVITTWSMTAGATTWSLWLLGPTQIASGSLPLALGLSCAANVLVGALSVVQGWGGRLSVRAAR